MPLSVGILTGLMWLPFGWIVQHWIGLFHALVRTALIVGVWYAFPAHRFMAVAFVVLAMYAITIPVLEGRWRANGRPALRAA